MLSPDILLNLFISYIFIKLCSTLMGITYRMIYTWDFYTTSYSLIAFYGEENHTLMKLLIYYKLFHCFLIYNTRYSTIDKIYTIETYRSLFIFYYCYNIGLYEILYYLICLNVLNLVHVIGRKISEDKCKNIMQLCYMFKLLVYFCILFNILTGFYEISIFNKLFLFTHNSLNVINNVYLLYE